MFPTDAPAGKPVLLLQSGCPDCIVVKEKDRDTYSVILLSKENKWDLKICLHSKGDIKYKLR